ncbi:hypothetical protein CYY_006608 [Polysphondylium violaceum]|uniref:Protein kinase domain-containing protein n=1 Tax=Polysphondylium violaceum TaxID=133409 RepID=A0A8J4PRZ1_9MYCE|nr:hypothetical protein CYY_006608 [Polysphondylium violaceum]
MSQLDSAYYSIPNLSGTAVNGETKLIPYLNGPALQRHLAIERVCEANLENKTCDQCTRSNSDIIFQQLDNLRQLEGIHGFEQYLTHELIDPSMLVITTQYYPNYVTLEDMIEKGLHSGLEDQLISRMYFLVGDMHRAGVAHCNLQPSSFLVSLSDRLMNGVFKRVIDDIIISGFVSSSNGFTSHCSLLEKQYVSLYTSPKLLRGAEKCNQNIDYYSLALIYAEMKFQVFNGRELARPSKQQREMFLVRISLEIGAGVKQNNDLPVLEGMDKFDKDTIIELIQLSYFNEADSNK